MTRFTRSSVFLALLLLGFPLGRLHGSRADNPPAAGKEVVLKAVDITPKIFPERVFFRGQSAPVQFRNSGGVHFADDFYVLVDWWTAPATPRESRRNTKPISLTRSLSK